MKWARRYRARLRAAYRAALGSWRTDSYLAKRDQERLLVGVYVSKELLASGGPSVANMVAEDARKIALGATRRRMGIAPS